jgi:hypothetical protein
LYLDQRLYDLQRQTKGQESKLLLPQKSQQEKNTETSKVKKKALKAKSKAKAKNNKDKK